MAPEKWNESYQRNPAKYQPRPAISQNQRRPAEADRGLGVILKTDAFMTPLDLKLLKEERKENSLYLAGVGSNFDSINRNFLDLPGRQRNLAAGNLSGLK
jgi:hypothetical protein